MVQIEVHQSDMLGLLILTRDTPNAMICVLFELGLTVLLFLVLLDIFLFFVTRFRIYLLTFSPLVVDGYWLNFSQATGCWFIRSRVLQHIRTCFLDFQGLNSRP